MKRICGILLALALLIVIGAVGFSWWELYRPITLDAEVAEPIFAKYTDEIALVEERHDVTIEVFNSETLEPIKSTSISMLTDPDYDFSGLMSDLSLEFYTARHDWWR